MSKPSAEIDTATTIDALDLLWASIDEAAVPRACVVVPLASNLGAHRERVAADARLVHHALVAVAQVRVLAATDGLGPVFAPKSHAAAGRALAKLDAELRRTPIEKRLANSRRKFADDLEPGARWPNRGPFAWQVDHLGQFATLLQEHVFMTWREVALLLKYSRHRGGLREDDERPIEDVMNSVRKAVSEWRRGQCATCGRIHGPKRPEDEKKLRKKPH